MRIGGRVGKRGPKPFPIALKLLKGRPHRATRELKEPKLDAPGDPSVPEELQGVAAEAWTCLYGMLVESGVVTKGDVLVLKEFCHVVGELSKIKAAIRELPIEAAIMKGLTKRETGLRHQFMQLSDRLGLNPSARSGVKSIEPKKEESKLKKYLTPARTR